MRYFPIFVDLQDRKVVVVGGGEEAVRKVRLLKKTSAKISVIARELHPELQGSDVLWAAKSYDPSLLDGAALIYSADKHLNARVSGDAQARGIPVNAVDEADISTFIVPSIVDRDPVVVAIGTEGTAPVLGQNIRAQIDEMLPQITGSLATAAEKIRPRVAEQVPHGNRRRSFWQRFFFGDPRDAIASGDSVAFELAVNDAIYFESQPPVGKITTVALTSDDPELLTIKAHRLLREADVIVSTGEIPPSVLEMARRDAVRLAAQTETGASVLAKAEASHGLHVTIITLSRAADSARVVPFPVREDIRDAILRAV